MEDEERFIKKKNKEHHTTATLTNSTFISSISCHPILKARNFLIKFYLCSMSPIIYYVCVCVYVCLFSKKRETDLRNLVSRFVISDHKRSLWARRRRKSREVFGWEENELRVNLMMRRGKRVRKIGNWKNMLKSSA